MLDSMPCPVMHEMKKSGKHLKEINHKFMESGHTHFMEASTIQAAIESSKRKITIEI